MKLIPVRFDSLRSHSIFVCNDAKAGFVRAPDSFDAVAPSNRWAGCVLVDLESVPTVVLLDFNLSMSVTNNAESIATAVRHSLPSLATLDPLAIVWHELYVDKLPSALLPVGIEAIIGGRLVDEAPWPTISMDRISFSLDGLRYYSPRWRPFTTDRHPTILDYLGTTFRDDLLSHLPFLAECRADFDRRLEIFVEGLDNLAR